MIEFAAGLDAGVRAVLGDVDPCTAVLAPRGTIVRCTPRRVTTMHTLPVAGGERAVFCKARLGSVAVAEAEWYWLHELARRGFAVSAPVYFARVGERTVVATLAAPGRPLPAFLLEVGREAAFAHASGVVAPLVRRLHGEGLVYRDLYWQHLHATALSPQEQPTFIDVERVLRPRWCWQRWVVKDLAGLVASWPLAGPEEAARWAAELVAAYRGRADRDLVQRVLAKAARLAAHTPRWGV